MLSEEDIEQLQALYDNPYSLEYWSNPTLEEQEYVEYNDLQQPYVTLKGETFLQKHNQPSDKPRYPLTEWTEMIFMLSTDPDCQRIKEYDWPYLVSIGYVVLIDGEKPYVTNQGRKYLEAVGFYK